MLSEQELDTMRSWVEEVALPDDAVIKRISAETRTRGGGYVQTWGTVWTGKARMAPSVSVGTQDRETLQRIEAGGDWTVTLPHGTSISSKDRVEMNGVTMEVITVEAPRSFSVQVRASCSVIG